jgi:hypothetical protein
MEQVDAELDLELAHLLAEARLRKVQPLGRAAEMELFRDGDEVANST